MRWERCPSPSPGPRSTRPTCSATPSSTTGASERTGSPHPGTCPSAWEDGRLVAQQDVGAECFAVRRTVHTGSWVGRAHQGRGIGKEMRAAVLHFAFAALGAQRAETDAFVDNPASLAVTRSLGYEPNGDGIHDRKGEPVAMLRYAMSRQSWERRRHDDISVEGLEPCLTMFGLDPAPAP
ncbi:MAG: GNAT family protein [Acidimicrobiales bacterium]